ncbi:MAG TPA: hypothetical protein VFP34_04970 [Microlunatus sp.]|nr:hypothetical protein [Microlunatus sp.]
MAGVLGGEQVGRGQSVGIGETFPQFPRSSALPSSATVSERQV